MRRSAMAKRTMLLVIIFSVIFCGWVHAQEEKQQEGKAMQCLAENILAEKSFDLEMVNDLLNGEQIRLNDEIEVIFSQLEKRITTETFNEMSVAIRKALVHTAQLLDQTTKIFEDDASYANECVLTRKLQEVQVKQDEVIFVFDELKYFASMSNLALSLRAQKEADLMAAEEK